MNDKAKKIIIGLVVVALAGAAVFVMNDLGVFGSPSEMPKYEMPEQEQPKQTTLFFAGDIMLSRNVARNMIQSKDYAMPFLGVLDMTKKADLAFANLESPFSQQGPYYVDGSLVFNADPQSIAGLKQAGFDVLSTANNHGFDQGRAGLEYTRSWLRENFIIPVGTGTDCHEGVIMEANGIKFGYLAYSYTALNDGGKSKDPLVCDWNDMDAIWSDIFKLNSKVDFVIVSAHMGTEYQREPDEANALSARMAIDAGADMIIGHHPHWFQTIEEYKGKYIFYSLGNFVFDQMWSQETREGLGLNVTFKGQALDRITLLPVVIDNYCCPSWAISAQASLILAKINSRVSSPTMVQNGKTAADWVEALKPKSPIANTSDLTGGANMNKND